MSSKSNAWELVYKTVLDDVNEIADNLVKEGSIEPINKLILFCQLFLSEENVSKEKIPMPSIGKAGKVGMPKLVINLPAMDNWVDLKND